jgi:hypothetical protein
MNVRKSVSLVLLGLLAGCAPQYALVGPGRVAVAGAKFRVEPGIAWNKAPPSPELIKYEEDWTQDGFPLDRIAFIGGLPDGQAIVKQRRKADRKVPTFRATMSPQDLVSMVEAAYAIRAGAKLFEVKGVEPCSFVGQPGLSMTFAFVGEDEVKRRGRAVVAIVDRKLYMMTLDGTALHYFDAALPDFQQMATTARLR